MRLHVRMGYLPSRNGGYRQAGITECFFRRDFREHETLPRSAPKPAVNSAIPRRLLPVFAHLRLSAVIRLDELPTEKRRVLIHADYVEARRKGRKRGSRSEVQTS